MPKSLLFLLLVFLPWKTPAQNLRIIPVPASMALSKGELNLKTEPQIHASTELIHEHALLKNYFRSKLKLPQRKHAVTVELLTDSVAVNGGKYGYELKVDQDGILIKGGSSAGVFYGLQTLKQLIKKEKNGKCVVPYVRIADQPRFAWREFMLDEARYFKGKEVVKQLLDEMALLKMNIFHWHLTDNTGWRIEIKKYPLLTAVGAKRDSSEIKINGQRGFYDGKPHNGFYTRQEIREIVEYAAQRYITVIPEIDIPGHTSAAIAAYPWLGSSSMPIKVPSSFANQSNVLRVSDPRVQTFVQDVLDEVIALFPSNVIHIGGDEVKYEHWNESKEIQAFIKERRLASPADLQLWFINSISRYLESKGRRMVGWNEILGDKIHEEPSGGDLKISGNLASNTIIDFWKGDVKLMRKAAENGYDIVNSLNYKTYMDITKIKLFDAYGFEPIPEGLSADNRSKILGSACHMWSEWIPTVTDLQHRVFPKLAVFAEIGWSQKEKKSFDEFLKALSFFHQHWQDEGINYSSE